ncbi:citrate lyase subunit beta / citryl-CoA lyase [Gammaproteobacteria bacterium]
MHPTQILFSGEKSFPVLPAVDHYAGSEKLIRKALALQREMGPLFDVTCDCEDGARAGDEAEHALMCAEIIHSAENRFNRVAARIHDITHPHWRADIDILVGGAGQRLAFLTLPKPRALRDVVEQIAELRRVEDVYGIGRRVPVHVMIETHGALKDAWAIAALESVESLDFGIMDFVSAHHGALPSSVMKSPGQFQHPLMVRAKSEIVAAALGNGVVPTHNVSTELKDGTSVFADARQARREFGFLRMWSIHPNQVRPILDAMRPDFAEVADAALILTTAQDQDWGPIKHQDRLHDRASYRYYWQLLQRAHATGMDLPSEVVDRFFLPDLSKY